MLKPNSHKICIAPMLGYTDKHFRYFIRLLSRHIFLYTEMVNAKAILHSDPKRYLPFQEKELPLALQLAGNVPNELAQCAKIGENFGYTEINFNVGCPSQKVLCGDFGASLMLKPNLVCDCIKAMVDAVSIPVTVKTRVGIANSNLNFLSDFVDTVSKAPCKTFIIHAREAFLNESLNKNYNGILQYEKVHQLKKDFPDLEIIINGGIKTLDDISTQLKFVDGVMIGRAACKNPYFLAEIDSVFFNDTHKIFSRKEITNLYLAYLEEQLKNNIPINKVIRPLINLFHGTPNAKNYRRCLSEKNMDKISLLLQSENE